MTEIGDIFGWAVMIVIVVLIILFLWASAQVDHRLKREVSRECRKASQGGGVKIKAYLWCPIHKRYESVWVEGTNVRWVEARLDGSEE